MVFLCYTKITTLNKKGVFIEVQVKHQETKPQVIKINYKDDNNA